MTCLLTAIALCAAACASQTATESSDTTDDAATATVTTVVVLAGTDAPADPTTEPPPPASTAAPATTAPGTTAPDDPEPTAAPIGSVCEALERLVEGSDPEAEQFVLALADPAEAILPAALRIIGSTDAVPELRAAAVAGLAAISGGADCPLGAAPSDIVLTSDGLALPGGTAPELAPFGAERGSVVAALTVLLGVPVVDTGPIEPFSVYGTCGGVQLWAVEWPGVVTLFTDDGSEPETFAFTTWRSYEQDGVDVDPGTLPRTDLGIGVGSPVEDVAVAYPDATGLFDELVGGESFFLEDEFWFAAADNSPTITYAEAGFLCGE